MNERGKNPITKGKVTHNSFVWQRCGESFFHVRTVDNTRRSATGNRHGQRPAFGNKWIHSEDFLFSNTEEATKITADSDSEEIALSDSSDSPDSKDSSTDYCPINRVMEGTRKRKRGTTMVWKRKKSNKAKTDHVSADCNHSESDTCDIISASESEGDDAKKETDSERPAASSGEIPPDQQIEFAHSPVHLNPVSPENETESAHETKRHTTPERDSSPQGLVDGGTPTISSCSSSQAITQESDVSPVTSGLKLSEWVKHMHWQTTPNKSLQPTSPEAEVDSAKKKKKQFKKHSKGGLAEQLERLMSREKSANHIWLHQQATGEGLQGSWARCLTVKITNLETVYSLHVACCVVLESSADKSLPGVQCKVLFSHLVGQQLSLVRPGATVKIFPPWQQLSLPNEEILFCNRYLPDTYPPSGNKCLQVQEQQSSGLNEEHVYGRWTCPCLKDSRIKSADCQAHKQPFLITSLEHLGSTESEEKRSLSEHMLHTVACSSKFSKKCLRFDTLLESIERTRPEDKILPSFKAMVIRVFHWRDSETSKDRCDLLVEDSQGTVAVIQGAENCVSRDTKVLEGCVYCFTGLQVKSRTNRDKDPALFSAVEAAWLARSQRSTSMSQGEGSVGYSQGMARPPPFWYLLEGESTSDVFLGVDTVRLDDTEPCRSSLLNTQLIANILKTLCTSHRVSFLGKVLYTSCSSQSPSSEEEKEILAEIFVVDSSLTNKDCIMSNVDHNPFYSKVSIVSGCSTDDLVLDMSRGGDMPYVALFMDVWIVGDRWLADKYSSLCCIDKDNEKVRDRIKILSPDHLQSVRDCEVYLPSLTLAAGVNSLVQISGVIQSIDENSAISWDECDSCGSNQLGMWSSNGTTVCVECKKAVEKPVQRMKMDAFVLDENISSVVKISFLQSTIQQILPEEHDEEGYDVSSVLSKHVGPLNCIITSPGTKTTYPVARQIF